MPGIKSRGLDAPPLSYGSGSNLVETTSEGVPAFASYAHLAAGYNDLGVTGYFESHLSGAMSGGQLYGGGHWINLDAATLATDGSILAAQDNGVYDNGATLTSGIIIFGLRAELIVSSTDYSRACPFSINTGNHAITAMFMGADTGPSIGYVANTGTTSSKIGDVPYAVLSDGTVLYVRIYGARG